MKITEKELKDLIKEVILESHTKADEKTLKKMSKKLRGSSKLHAKQADELEDIVDRSDDDELEEVVFVRVKPVTEPRSLWSKPVKTARKKLLGMEMPI
jgi:predicted house-cleaning noncanonical NTP pyrophosphatase (MazG superfamily)